MIPPARTILMVYHSTTGATEQAVGAAAAAAAKAEGIAVVLRHAGAATATDVLQADAYLFASPEYLAALSGEVKAFFDRTYYAALDRVNGRPFASLICAGNEGQGAARQLDRIVTGWRLKPIADTLIVNTGAHTPEQIQRPKRLQPGQLQQCADLGATLAYGVAAGIF